MTRALTRLTTAAALATATAAFGATPAGAAQLLFGVTPDNRLISFSSQAPEVLRSSIPLIGLAPGERILGMDQRPSTGQIYLLATSGRLYVVNPFNSLTRQVGTRTIPLSGSSFAFDFNPVTDSIRIVSDADQNLRVNPGNVRTVRDRALTYAAGDAGAGTSPTVTAVAYTNSVRGATTTELLGLDTARNTLVKQDPPNSGVLRTRGLLNLPAEPQEVAVAYDIAGNGTGYAAFRLAGRSDSVLFTVDPASGATARAGVRSGIIGRNETLVGMTAVAEIGDDRRAPVSQWAATRTRTGIAIDYSCSEACIFTARLQTGTREVTASSDIRAAGPGRLQVRLDRAFVSAFTSTPGSTFRVTATDFAGNAGRTRSVRFPGS